MPASRNPKPGLLRSGDEPETRRTAAASGSGIALALGGGFARGFAHLGVLDVLEQAEIPIAFIVGTSIGGLLGAAYADGISIRQLCELGRQVRVRDLVRFHKPVQDRQGSGEPSAKDRQLRSEDLIGKFVREWFRATRLEDLQIRTAVVATDLDTGAPYVFTRGPLDVAVRAGCAFPGLFPPVEHEGRRLADGCIVAPVPAAVAVRMNCACVLGVTVDPNARMSLPQEDDSRPLSRGSLSSSWARQLDVLLEPEVAQINWTDFSRVDDAYRAGAEAMWRALPRVRELIERRSQLLSVEEASGQSRGGVTL